MDNRLKVKIQNLRYNPAIPLPKLNKPSQVYLILTRKCKFRCAFCDYWKNKKDKRISLDKIKEVLDDSKKWLGNDFELVLTGGDIFLYNKIYDLFEYIAENNISTTLYTDGLSLSRKNIGRIIKTRQINTVLISLPTFDKKKYNELRKPFSKDALEKVKNNVLLLNKLSKNRLEKLSIIIAPLVFDQDLSSLKKIYEFSKKNNFYIFFQPLREKISSEIKGQTYKDLHANLSYDSRISDFLLKIKKQDPKVLNLYTQLKLFSEYYERPLLFYKKRQCFVFNSRMVIDPEGNLTLCYKSGIVGNINDSKIKEIWTSNKASDKRKELKYCKEYCRITSFEYSLDPLDYFVESFFYLKKKIN